MTATTETIGGDLRPAAASPTSRIDRLAEQVRRIRTRAGDGNLDRWLLIVGGTLMPLGILLILLGWAGAAHTPLTFEQNDYLISGGILGLGLTVAGGFVYFAYWQTVRVRDSRMQAKALADAFARLEALLSGGAVSGGQRSLTSAGGVTETFVATANGSIFHRRDCPAVAGREDLQQVDTATTSLRPCRICSPLDEA